MCTMKTPTMRKALVVPWGTREPFPFTPWLPASKIKEVQFLTNIVEQSNGIDLSPAYQTANDIDSPDAMTDISGVTYTQEGMATTSVVDFSSITDGKYFIRFGVTVKRTGGGSGHCLLELTVAARD